MRNSILSLIVFFILGLLFLLTLRGKKLRDDVTPEVAAIGPPPATPNVGMPATKG